jgi:hypothetical protein
VIEAIEWLGFNGKVVIDVGGLMDGWMDGVGLMMAILSFRWMGFSKRRAGFGAIQRPSGWPRIDDAIHVPLTGFGFIR